MNLFEVCSNMDINLSGHMVKKDLTLSIGKAIAAFSDYQFFFLLLITKYGFLDFLVFLGCALFTKVTFLRKLSPIAIQIYLKYLFVHFRRAKICFS
jgi:hypothetical protein